MNPADIFKRAERSNYEQPTHGRCIICKNPFQTCPHNMREVNEAILAAKLSKYFK